MYLLGIEFLKESNESEGISLLQKASDLDNDKAQIQLANFLFAYFSNHSGDNNIYLSNSISNICIYSFVKLVY